MIKFDNVTKSFDDLKVLDDLSLEIPKGAAYGLLGTNGAGKSTFLRLLSGIYKVDGGSVTVDGQPVWDNVSVKGRLLLVSDTATLVIDIHYLPLDVVELGQRHIREVETGFDAEAEDFRFSAGGADQNSHEEDGES